ncbi:10736_t:CDS:2 [Diversispora eburnea]|uniref:10736_t:CDS:1 n=1 Tax=Diversispora eburnea TaxID=1213867 RepID=A0A9N8WKD6_9GLOM|nr:10736_t:CDS:2 [Diversispora eburnea]
MKDGLSQLFSTFLLDGQAHISNILKIIFNFSGVARSIILYTFEILSTIEFTQTQCTILVYFSVLANFFYRQALGGFLLWRLKQIEYSTWDRSISFVLYATRTILNIILLGYLRPNLSDPRKCDNGGKYGFLIIQLGFIGIDFIIDSFFTVRLIQILNDGNRNAATLNSIIGRKTPKRTLFTAVLYWNFLRLTIDFLYNGIYVLNTLKFNKVDVSILDETRAVSTSSRYSFRHRSIYSPPSTWIKEPSYRQQQTASFQLDKGKFVVVSMQRLTFFEWANMCDN